ncbi:BURP domain protein RD22 isoform X1 [Manihot esculenta]|nr:BURP domain protein RD22 isoform X1 [Manihot esculenta]
MVATGIISMEFHLLLIFALFTATVLKGSHASVPPELYWQSMLPNTPFPKTLKDFLHPADIGKKITFSFQEDYMPENSLEIPRTTYDVAYWPDNRKFVKKSISNATTVYFLYHDLLPGKNMRIIFTKSTNGSNFLPRKIAESIPFSSNKFPEILNYFSIKSTSKESEIMKQTIEECEAPPIRGEDKYCATSLESLVDLVAAKFGQNVQAIYNEAEEENKKQEYTILQGIKMMGENHMVCHKQKYAYAVFYCHRIKDTKVYKVPLMGVDGSKAEAAVVCHMDTSAWHPHHYAFQILNVKPGGPPICHFLNSDAIVWISSS